LARRNESWAPSRKKMILYGAEILAPGEARGGSIPAGGCDRRATKPGAKRSSQMVSGFFWTVP
jgi:hypothetical protein